MTIGTNSYIRAWLDSKEFYELCQSYRHAGDCIPRAEGLPTASEAFEALKDEIEKRHSGPKGEAMLMVPVATLDRIARDCEYGSRIWKECDAMLRAYRLDATHGEQEKA